MLSYRHIFHAGNHADVLKHFCLYEVLRYYNQKDKPYVYIDTHAGTACYDLGAEQAQKTREYATGIDLLHDAKQLPEPLEDFKHFIDSQEIGSTRGYLGSAALAGLLLRAGDQMRLFERHPQDYALLQDNMASIAPQAKYFLSNEDGYKGLISALPPHTRRAVILIDPSYEVKDEYALVPRYLEQAIKRFPQGCYIIWAPLLARYDAMHLASQLKQTSSENYLWVTLTVERPPADGLGMFGSQLFIVNPPYTLPQRLESALTEMVDLLARDDSASYQLDYRIS